MSEKTHDTGFAWFPASHWIRPHTRQSVRLDLIAGLSLAAFVIPEALAYGGLAPRTYRRLTPIARSVTPGIPYRDARLRLLLAAAGSLVMLIAQASRPTVVVLGREPTTGRFVNRDRYPDAGDPPGALVVRSAGGWFYFNADHIRRRISDLVEAAPAGLQAVVIDCSIVPYIDTTAGTALRVLARRLKGQGIAIALAELRDDVRENLKAIGAEQDRDPPKH